MLARPEVPDIAHLIGQGQVNLWVFVPSALLLGALHGLEPGHSKTMMAAFIVAVRGTVAQAILLGVSATASHTAVVWAVALGGLYFGQRFNLAVSEPYFQMGSAGLVLGVAAWMAWRTFRENSGPDADHDHNADHDHPHPAHGADPRFAALADASDPHERAHALEIRTRFAGKAATTGQIVVFGLTGGLIPCPASITVLLLCLQLKQVAMGAGLVLCFSLGLAATMVSVGVLAALGVRHVETRWSAGMTRLARRAPYFSALLIALVGLVLAAQAWIALAR